MHILIGLITLGLLLCSAIFLAQVVITLAIMVASLPITAVQLVVQKIRTGRK